jgi:hypothetical protein
MLNQQTIEEKLDRLERSNRRLKIMMSVSFCIGAVLLFTGAGAPRVVEAEKFILRDSSGAERGEMFATDTARGLVFFTKGGEKGLAFVVSDEMNALMISDPNGNLRQTLTANMDESRLGLYRPGSNSAQFEVINNALGTALTIRDRGNADRVSLGESAKGAAVVMSDSKGGARTIMGDGALGFASLAKDGGIVWSPGWDKFSPEEQKQMNNVIRNSPKQ